MENSPLNMAHQQHRRADAHLRYKRFEDAMFCHNNAAELLLDAMKSTTSSVALESLSLQHSYHLKQKDIIKSKKEQFDRVKKVIDNLKYLSRELNTNYEDHQGSKLQIAIYRAINETDSLLNTLLKPYEHLLTQDEGPSTKRNEDVKFTKTENEKTLPSGKKSKDNPMVIEELQILSQNLHSLVDQLVLQIEVVKDENSLLKERVNYLENERKRYLNFYPSVPDYCNRENLRVLTDSAEGNSSPFIVSPCTELSPESAHEKDRELPPLAPLEMPNFDLSIFKKHISLHNDLVDQKQNKDN